MVHHPITQQTGESHDPNRKGLLPKKDRGKVIRKPVTWWEHFKTCPKSPQSHRNQKKKKIKHNPTLDEVTTLTNRGYIMAGKKKG